MKLSKFQIILLIVFGALSVAGVLIFAFAVGGGGGNTIGQVTVWGTLDQNAFTTVLRAAAESNSQLNQVVYEQKDPVTYETELLNALASGGGPDLFILRQDHAMKNAGKILPIQYTSLSESQFEATFVQAAAPFLSQSGILAVPFVIDPLVLYWNRDLFGAAGYAKPPVFWDEVLPMASYITGGSDQVNSRSITRRDQANAIKKSAIAFGEFRNVDNAKEILSTLIMQAGGKITMRDSSARLIPAIAPKTGESLQSTDTALRFYTEFADPSKNHYSWSRALPESRAAFAAGDLGLYIGYASEEPLIRRMNPNLNFGVASMPQIRPTDPQNPPDAINFGFVYGFAISRASDNPNGAVTVAYLLASSPLSKNLSIALGIPSARTDVLQPLFTRTRADDELGVQASREQIIGTAAIIARSWIDPDPEKTNDIFKDMIENTSSGAARITDAVSRADQELGNVLGL